jgi:tRNA(adenine34) deaminase
MLCRKRGDVKVPCDRLDYAILRSCFAGGAGNPMEHRVWMREALAEANRAAALGEVPVGAVVVSSAGLIVGRGHNRRELDGDPLAHAEVLAIRDAAKHLGEWRLVGCTVYATLEPCAMCAGALVNSRVERLVFGAADRKAGYCGTLGNVAQDPRLNHRLEVVAGVLEEECAQLLSEFFSKLRSSGMRLRGEVL